MREIKFRAWHKKYKRMYKVMSLNMDEREGVWAHVWGRDPINNSDFLFAIQPKDIVVMQYTGIKDKSGEEIYEGDILDASYMSPLSGERIQKIYKVFHKNATFYVEMIDTHANMDRSLQFVNKDAEIIGNIYDNPELSELWKLVE